MASIQTYRSEHLYSFNCISLSNYDNLVKSKLSDSQIKVVYTAYIIFIFL